jgi:hypothetical protein
MTTTPIPSRVTLALAAALAAIVTAPVDSSLAGPKGDQAPLRAEALFGRAWVAKAIVKDGRRHRLVKGTRLVLRLRHQGEHDVASWRTGCNDFAARVEVGTARLSFGRITQTMKGCRPALERQDRRIARFLGSDPRWKRKGGRLILRSGDDAIRLKRRARAAASSS